MAVMIISVDSSIVMAAHGEVSENISFGVRLAM